MGGGRTQTTTTISNPYAGLPDFARNYFKQDLKRGEQRIGDIGQITRGLVANPRHIVGISPEEFRAINDIGREGNLLDTRMEDALGYIGGDEFMSGYTDDVVDTTLAGMRREADRARVARGASEASFGGLTGSRAGVADALGEQLTRMDMAQMEAQLRDRAHEFGVGAGANAAGLTADIAGADFGAGLQEGGALGAFGALRREKQQEAYDSDRLNSANAMEWYTRMYNTLRQPPSTGGGMTTGSQPGPSVGSQILGGLTSAAGIWTALSDERAKEDIEVFDGALDLLRKTPAYSYKYKDGYGHRKDRTAGLMAQDLEVIEGAVMEREDGMKVVDPYPVLATVVQAVRELDQRTRGEAA